MRHYEVMIVLDPSLPEDGHNKQLERVKKVIEGGGGTVVRDDRWGIRTLAYEIKKQTQGYYAVLEWEGPAELVSELDHSLRLDENVLRHLVIHLDPVALQTQEEMRSRRPSRPPTVEEDERLDLEDDEEDDEFGLDLDEEVEDEDEDSGLDLDEEVEDEDEDSGEGEEEEEVR